MPSVPRSEAPAPDETVRDAAPWGARPARGAEAREDAPRRGRPGGRAPTAGALVAGAGALVGFLFAAVSTHDFAAHLDRQVHGVSCSFLPGVTEGPGGSSGCHATLMSPWSSFLRDQVWGGVPIALLAMAVFAFVAFAVAALVLARRQEDRRATAAFAALAGVPVAATLFWGAIATFELGATCKICIGIYVGSALVAVGAALLWRRARRTPPGVAPLGATELAVATAALGAFVALAVGAYVLAAPSHARYVDGCGVLDGEPPPAAVTVPLAAGEGPPALEILDPLCPACRVFERRLEASAVGGTLPRTAVLFPLDDRCNWMVSEAVHPGACVVSEALLCAGPDAPAVLDWAFEAQASLLEEARRRPEAVSQRVLERFPRLRGCLGSAAVRAKINRGLRWAVEQELPVLTPQLYVGGLRLCDEDTDLGLDYALPRLARAAVRIPVEARQAPKASR